MTATITSFPGREIKVKGKNHLYFGGTSYLGLQTDIEFQNLFIQNIKKYGTNYGASRKANIQIAVFEEAEKNLASLVGAEACITVSSGYLAGQLISQTLQGEGHPLFYAPNTHAALYQHASKIFESWAALQLAIHQQLESTDSSPVVLLDAIDFSNNLYPDFNGLKKLPLDKILLVIDDSHGLGIIGENGSGVHEIVSQLSPKELIVCSSLGKGFALQAGALFASKERVAQLSLSKIYGGASPPTPAAMATYIDGVDLFSKKRKVLNENIQVFVNQLKRPEYFESIDNYPAFGFHDVALTTYLEENGILITNFNYPTADSPMTSRIVISAHHTRKDINKLTDVLNAYL